MIWCQYWKKLCLQVQSYLISLKIYWALIVFVCLQGEIASTYEKAPASFPGDMKKTIEEENYMMIRY